MTQSNLPAFPLSGFQQAIDTIIGEEFRRLERVFAVNPPSSREYVMVDLCGNVLQARRMSPSEVRDTNLELEALETPYYWTPLAEMFD